MAGIPSNPSEETKRRNPHLYGASGMPHGRTELTAKAPPASGEGSDSGKRPRGKRPNKTEQRMLDIFEARKRRGEIDSYRYEGMTLKWGMDEKTGQAMRYTGDVVVFRGREITIIEVKGAHIRDRDVVRFKGCRAGWPELHFELWQWKSGEWRRLL